MLRSGRNLEGNVDRHGIGTPNARSSGYVEVDAPGSVGSSGGASVAAPAADAGVPRRSLASRFDAMAAQSSQSRRSRSLDNNPLAPGQRAAMRGRAALPRYANVPRQEVEAIGTLFDQRSAQRPTPYVEAPRSEALTDAEMRAAFTVLRGCVREYHQAGLWEDILRLCRNRRQADAYRSWMSEHATEVALNPADARAPKVIEGRRTIKSINLVRAEEVNLVLRMPSRSDKTVTYKIGLRVPDVVRRRDGGMIPLREHVKHCSCPDFTKRYLVQGMNTSVFNPLL